MILCIPLSFHRYKNTTNPSLDIASFRLFDHNIIICLSLLIDKKILQKSKFAKGTCRCKGRFKGGTRIVQIVICLGDK